MTWVAKRSSPPLFKPHSKKIKISELYISERNLRKNAVVVFLALTMTVTLLIKISSGHGKLQINIFLLL